MISKLVQMIYDIVNLLFLKIALEYYECDHKLFDMMEL